MENYTSQLLLTSPTTKSKNLNALPVELCFLKCTHYMYIHQKATSFCFCICYILIFILCDKVQYLFATNSCIHHIINSMMIRTNHTNILYCLKLSPVSYNVESCLVARGFGVCQCNKHWVLNKHRVWGCGTCTCDSQSICERLYIAAGVVKMSKQKSSYDIRFKLRAVKRAKEKSKEAAACEFRVDT